MEYNAGKLELSKKQKNHLEDLLMKIRSYEDSVADLSLRAGATKKQMWDIVHDWFPGCIDYNMNASINEGELSLIIVSKKPNPERSAKPDSTPGEDKIN